MRRILLIIFISFALAPAYAQKNTNGDKGRFDPKNFEERLEKYVVKEANITKEESAKFLPIYREMRRQIISILNSEREMRQKKPTTEKEWEAALRAHDNWEVQLKKVTQVYHNRMLTAVPASKVMTVMRAEDDFYRDSFTKMQKDSHPKPHGAVGPPPPPGKRKK